MRFLAVLGLLPTQEADCLLTDGTEIVALAAAEAKNPSVAIPRSIRKVWIRIVLFYIISVLMVGLLVSSQDPRLNLDTGDAASSPYVIAIQDAGIAVSASPRPAHYREC